MPVCTHTAYVGLQLSMSGSQLTMPGSQINMSGSPLAMSELSMSWLQIPMCHLSLWGWIRVPPKQRGLPENRSTEGANKPYY